MDTLGTERGPFLIPDAVSSDLHTTDQNVRSPSIVIRCMTLRYP